RGRADGGVAAGAAACAQRGERRVRVPVAGGDPAGARAGGRCAAVREPAVVRELSPRRGGAGRGERRAEAAPGGQRDGRADELPADAGGGAPADAVADAAVPDRPLRGGDGGAAPGSAGAGAGGDGGAGWGRAGVVAAV